MCKIQQERLRLEHLQPRFEYNDVSLGKLAKKKGVTHNPCKKLLAKLRNKVLFFSPQAI